jgi:uncharacterized membrane protein
MSATATREFDYLEKAGLVLLALQFAVFAALWTTAGFDRASDGYPILIMATALFVAGQRRMATRPVNRGAARWLVASRTAVLALMTLATLTVAFYRLVPAAAPAPDFVPQALFALLWMVIALKGAGIGKLKPNRIFGLRVSWTCQSRLAWDRAHRALGRILFWGGLAGLATSLVVEPFTSVALWAATVTLAVTTALVESWRAWRLDPNRTTATTS